MLKEIELGLMNVTPHFKYPRLTLYIGGVVVGILTQLIASSLPI